MRIGFANSSREPFRSAGARVRVGCAEGNDLVLSGTGIAERHLAIAEDRRGLVLEVLPGAQHVYVNARPVRERGLLRYGDVLSVGGCKLAMLPDDSRDEPSPPSSPHDVDAPPGFAGLRAVSGPMSGRLLQLEGKLLLTRGLLPAGVSRCELTLDRAGMHLDADAPVWVNGSPRKRALLRAGDQLTLGEHRFVLEAPGLEAEVLAAQEPVRDPRPAPIVVEPRRSRAESWWLLGTAAVLAAIIAVLLWWKH